MATRLYQPGLNYILKLLPQKKKERKKFQRGVWTLRRKGVTSSGIPAQISICNCTPSWNSKPISAIQRWQMSNTETDPCLVFWVNELSVLREVTGKTGSMCKSSKTATCTISFGTMLFDSVSTIRAPFKNHLHRSGHDFDIIKPITRAILIKSHIILTIWWNKLVILQGVALFGFTYWWLPQTGPDKLPQKPLLFYGSR